MEVGNYSSYEIDCMFARIDAKKYFKEIDKIECKIHSIINYEMDYNYDIEWKEDEVGILQLSKESIKTINSETEEVENEAEKAEEELKKLEKERDQYSVYDFENNPELYRIFEEKIENKRKYFNSIYQKKESFCELKDLITIRKNYYRFITEAIEKFKGTKKKELEKEYIVEEYVKENYMIAPEEKPDIKINYWGYKEAYYFAPKASYSAGKNPVNSFKNMVKELHKAGIEVIMQFYFPQFIERSYILEVIKYWVKEYHIDGVRLLGVNIPIPVIATQTELLNTKILHENIPAHEIYDYQYVPVYKNLANYNEGFLYAVRKFLKGDVGSLQSAFHAIVDSQKQIGNMVYLTNYNTFTLKDMVSFDRKHNEDNGENGRDGNYHNLSWNCGTEGNTKKKTVLALREKQMRNAIVFLMLAKGTPVIVAGDEFGNSQGGNNNPYCQDNVITWLNWKDLNKNQEHFQFTKDMISFMKKQPLLKKTREQMGRRNGVEYPYMSFHGIDAWKLDWSSGNEEAGGILYYGNYSYIYIGINMHWQEKELALPNIPGNHKWELLVDTSLEQDKKWIEEGAKAIKISPRSITIITAKGSKEDFNESFSAF